MFERFVAQHMLFDDRSAEELVAVAEVVDEVRIFAFNDLLLGESDAAPLPSGSKGIYVTGLSDDEVSMPVVCQVHHIRKRARPQSVVAIEECDVCARREVESMVACGGNALICLPYEFYFGMVLGVGGDDIRAAVSGAIVDHDDFDSASTLFQG